MELDRLAWWVAMALCWWYSWTVERRAKRAASRCSCNEEGSRILARLVMKLDEARRFVGKADGFRIEASHRFTVKGRTFLVTAIEVAPAESDEP